VKVWICGKHKSLGKDSNGTEYTSWEFQGVFRTKDLAINACKDENYFIGPAVMDEPLPDEELDWPGAYYPKEKREE